MLNLLSFNQVYENEIRLPKKVGFKEFMDRRRHGFEKLTKSDIEKIRNLLDKKGRYRVRFDYEYIEINSDRRSVEIIKLADYYFTVLDQEYHQTSYYICDDIEELEYYILNEL